MKVEDITEDKARKKERARLEEQLAKECFPRKIVKLDMPNLIGVRTSPISNRLADKYIGTITMTVYDKSILPQAQEFARRYEEQFGLKEHSTDFIIETDYSG